MPTSSASTHPSQNQSTMRFAARPATVRAYKVGEKYRRRDATVDEEAKKVLFGQTAASIRN